VQPWRLLRPPRLSLLLLEFLQPTWLPHGFVGKEAAVTKTVADCRLCPGQAWCEAQGFPWPSLVLLYPVQCLSQQHRRLVFWALLLCWHPESWSVPPSSECGRRPAAEAHLLQSKQLALARMPLHLSSVRRHLRKGGYVRGDIACDSVAACVLVGYECQPYDKPFDKQAHGVISVVRRNGCLTHSP